MNAPAFDYDAVVAARRRELDRRCAQSLRRAFLHAGCLLVVVGVAAGLVFGVYAGFGAASGGAIFLAVYAFAYNQGLIAGGDIAERTRAIYSEFDEN